MYEYCVLGYKHISFNTKTSTFLKQVYKASEVILLEQKCHSLWNLHFLLL